MSVCAHVDIIKGFVSKILSLVMMFIDQASTRFSLESKMGFFPIDLGES